MKIIINPKLKIKKNDKVIILKGKDRSKSGKVIKSIPKQNKVIVEGLNLCKKHKKPKKEGEVGQIVEIPKPINVSNVALICQHCNKPARIGYIIEKDKKFRICKKCNKKLD
jgi:large subunit ribosomal protein L24